ncbi:MAG TPA: hypothetical protein VMT87_06655 [Vicinamibacteria bacterium]|nr:hypothetical protein [Vicinamibacteria bacterium]
MRMRVAMVLVVLGAAGAASPALAIPGLARRYGVACDYCHQGYPKLNPMGQRFKERGLRMAQEDPFVTGDWLRSVPVSVRGWATRSLVEGASDSSSGVAKPITAGSLGRRLSYWADYELLVRQGDDTFEGAVDNAWAQVEVVTGGRLYAKVGRFELDLPFSRARSPHLFPYEIYLENPGLEFDAIGLSQDGLELGGGLPGDVRWSAAVVAGRDPPRAGDLSRETERFDANLFLRASKRLSQHRLGGFAYVARNTLASSPAIVWDDGILRVGGDVSLWFQRLNLYGVFLYGRNNNPLATPSRPRGTSQRATMAGGFLQGDYHWGDRVVLTLRTEAIHRPPPGTVGPRETFTSVYPGAQLFLRERFKLSFEYGLHDQGRRNRGAVQAEVAF